jgi:hypothetical protein
LSTLSLTRGSARSARFGESDALLESRLSLLQNDGFEPAGTIGFGGQKAVRFRSLCRGSLAPSPEPGLRLGTAVCEIDGGSGQLASATGRITSSFLVSDTGELTDHQLALIFVPSDPGGLS